MDLVSDFKRVINNNTDNCIEELKKVFIDIKIDKNKECYKDINKFYTGLVIWVQVLKEQEKIEEKKILLDNILLNYCSILNGIVLGDIKVINFLYRNVIESIVRYITGELTTQNLEQAFKNLSNMVDDNNKDSILIYVSRLKQIYDSTCLYIHTDTKKIDSRLTTLINFKKNSEEVNLDSIKEDFKKMNISIICILSIIFKKERQKMRDNAKGYLAEIIPLEDRIRIEQIR